MSISVFKVILRAVVAIGICLGVSFPEASASPEIEGPILLHGAIDQQWGGHTFAYLLEGEKTLFWSASAYNADGSRAQLVGSYPKPGSGLDPVTTIISIPDTDVFSMPQPLLLRSPDGYIHILFGVHHNLGNPNYAPGDIRYYRSHAPEDVSQVVERSELVPQGTPYNRFHLRMNAGVSEDGERAAIVALAISEDGSVPFNTPVIFQGRKQGADYAFAPAVAYAEPMGLFYPQIALLDSGTLILGQIWDTPGTTPTRLLQLDKEAKLVHRLDMPAESKGNFWCCDLRPLDANRRDKFAIYYNAISEDKIDCRHEFWTYEPASKNLIKHRSVPVPHHHANYGKWLPLSPTRSLFLHNPGMGRSDRWDGDLLGAGEIEQHSLPATDPALHGFLTTAYTFLPNPLQGSVPRGESIWFAADFIPRNKPAEQRGPCAYMLFRLVP